MRAFLYPKLRAGFILAVILLSSLGQAAELQQLHGQLPRATASLAPIGRLPSSQRLSFALGLPLRNQGELTNLLRQIYDPASTNYHHYLTPAQFTERFGPTEEDYQAVVAFAQANGWTVATRHPNRTLVDVSGSVTDVEKALHIRMNRYRHPVEARTFFAPDREPSMELRVPILGISGLDDYALPKSLIVRNQAASGRNVGPLTGTGSGTNGTYLGNDFRAAYVPDSALTGVGQTVGLLEFDGYTFGDITNYEDQAGLPNINLTNVLLDGFSGIPANTNAVVEVCLDIEMVISMAPQVAGVIVYEAGPYGNWHDMLNRMANDNLAAQMSCSWYIPDGGPDSVADQIFQQMAAQGQSFFAASGDKDAYSGAINFPDESPYITLVGGTTLTTSGPGGAWTSEKVWNWGYLAQDGGYIGSAGGISTSYAIPTWQTGVSMVNNQGSTTMRNVPDVALTADNVDVRANGLDQDVGGTSCAAPLWAAYAALMNQQAANNGSTNVGFINPAIYAIGEGPAYGSTFHDTTIGNNTNSSSDNKFFAAAGYDLCTGWGTPAGQDLIDAMVGPATALPPAIVSGPQSQTVPTTGNAYFNVTVRGLPPLAFQWLYNGTNLPGATNYWLTLTNLQPAQAGTYALLVTNDINSVLSSNAVLTVLPPFAPIVVGQPQEQSVPAGGLAEFSVSANGTPPLFYQWFVNGSNIIGATNATLYVFNVQATNEGYYAAQVSNMVSSVDSSNALLEILPPASNCVSAPAGLVGWWPAEGNANDAFDTNNGTLVNSVGFSTGEVGQAFNFDGSSYVDIPSSASLNVGSGGGFTIEMWIDPADVTQPHCLAEWSAVLIPIGGASFSISAPISFQPSSAGGPGCLLADLLDTKLNDHIVSTPAGFLLSNVWQHVAVTYNQTNGIAALFIDGSMVIETNLGIFTPETDYDLYLAYNVAGLDGACAYTGLMDEITLYSRALSPAEVESIYLAGSYGKCPLPPTQVAIQPASQTVYPGSSASFTALANGTPPLSYQWSFNTTILTGQTDNSLNLTNIQLTNAGLYSVQVSNGAGSVASSNAVLVVNPPSPPVITAQPASQSVRIGNSATFQVAAVGALPMSYQWCFNSYLTPISGATNSVLTLTDIQLEQEGFYFVQVANNYGSTQSSNAVLTVQDPPVIITQPMNEAVAAGGTATIQVSAVGPLPLSYQWYSNETPALIHGATNSVLTLTNVQLGQAGIYSVQVANGYGSTPSSNAVLAVAEYPNWMFTFAPWSYQWYSMASSADGCKLVAGAGSPELAVYLSTNSGVTWVPASLPADNFVAVASSADGTKLFAAGESGIDISTNSGGTWNVTVSHRGALACTTDATKLVVADYNNGIYTSTNFGASWTTDGAPQLGWSSVVSSADGSKLAAEVYFGRGIYVSTNAGTTWYRSSAPTNDSAVIACSADGSRLVAAYQPGLIYISTNSGSSWTATGAPNVYWNSIASSADGTRLTVAKLGGPIYVSTNSGVNWTAANAPSATWTAVVSSADGNKLAAAAADGGIYVWESVPMLGVGNYSNCLCLSWPLFWLGSTLQQNSDLGTSNWTDMVAMPVMTNGQCQVIIPNSAGYNFYRLKYP